MKFAVSPRQRWLLAQLFLHSALKVIGVEEQKRFNRTRLALRLSAPMALLVDGKPASDDFVKTDGPNIVELDEAGVDFILGKIAPLEISPYHTMVLGDFFEAVETAKLTKAAPVVDETLPEVPKDERWAATEEEIEEAKAKAAERERLAGASAGN